MKLENCSLCNGKGILSSEIERNPILKEFHGSSIARLKVCPKCLGHKTVDWIENIVGVKHRHDPEVYVKLIKDFQESVKSEYITENWWATTEEIEVYLIDVSEGPSKDSCTYIQDELIVGKSMEFKRSNEKVGL